MASSELKAVKRHVSAFEKPVLPPSTPRCVQHTDGTSESPAAGWVVWQMLDLTLIRIWMPLPPSCGRLHLTRPTCASIHALLFSSLSIHMLDTDGHVHII